MTNFRTYFITRAHNKNLTAEDMVLHSLHKARLAKTEDKKELAIALLKRAFSPLSRRSTYRNPYSALNEAVRMVNHRLSYDGYYSFMCAEEKLYYLDLIKRIGRF